MPANPRWGHPKNVAEAHRARLCRQRHPPIFLPFQFFDHTRIPAGIALTAGGLVGFLPIVGFWMVPLGLAVLAQDVPVMRPPLARLLAKVNGKRKPPDSTPQ
jgi:hypothetical protein